MIDIDRMTIIERQETLERGNEFRFEIDQDKEFEIQLQSGSAEFFGVELAVEKWYKFYGELKGAIFTWYGCTLRTRGDAIVAYISQETPMVQVMNLHAQLESRRDYAVQHQPSSSGPRILIAGPTDSGKTSLSRILLNYALRLGRKPTFIDLDVGQNSLAVPGAISSTPLDMNTLSINEGPFRLVTPLIFYYGYASPSDNAEFYKICVENLANAVNQRMNNDAEVNASGFVLNTCGWVEGLGYRLLEHAIQVFRVDVILVLGQDRLYSELKRGCTSNDIAIVKLDRSGGVVPRNKMLRRLDRMKRIREYFYGSKCIETGANLLSPCATEISFDEVELYMVADVKVSDAILPVGQTEDMQQLQVVRLNLTTEIVCSLTAIVHDSNLDTNNMPNALMQAATAGFLFIKEVDPERRVLSVLAPCPGPLPSKYLLTGNIKWME